ncbi:MAG: cyclic nucleotide-binding domain-containing protein [Kofleriaceae bacterium]|nr:cyclic nucleotide-binding domain-containing protein [Kofleriaceae bacterium]
MDRLARATALAGCPVLAGVPAPALLAAADRAAAVPFAAGAPLALRADGGDVVLIVARGRVRVDGAEVGPGGLIGELAAFDDEAAAPAAEAVDDGVAVRLFRDDFLDLLLDHPGAARALAGALAARIRDGNARS